MVESLYLVADVGGTNCRLALADVNGVRTDTINRFQNKKYASFSDIVRIFLCDKPKTNAAVVAIAGPVDSGCGQLTNWDWYFNAEDLAHDLLLDKVYLLNDLEALGYAVSVLPKSSLRCLSGSPNDNEFQAIVMGLGTGFNISLACNSSNTVFAAEMGHAALPQPVVTIIHNAVGEVHAFETVEHLFSGRGLAKLHEIRTGSFCKPEDVENSKNGSQTLTIMACALGALVREVAYLYLPENGIYFNGSLAHTLLSAATTEFVLAPLKVDDRFGGRMARIPICILTDDISALYGCAHYISLQS